MIIFLGVTVMKKSISIILILSVMFMLSACARTDINVSESISENNQTISSTDELTKKDELVLTDTAKLLTYALANSTVGFSNDPKKPTTVLTAPNTDNPSSLYNFITLVMLYHNSKYGYENSIYSKSVYCDENHIYHIQKNTIHTILKDVFDIENFNLENIGLDYDKENEEYTSGLEFGIGYNWACDDISNVDINWNERSVIVDYSVEYKFRGAAPIENEITKIACQNTYSIEFKDNDKMYLKLKSIKTK